MKKIYIFFAICATILAASCTKEELGQNEDKKTEVKYVPMEFTSSVETKTVLSEGTVNWLDGDVIAVIDNSEQAETNWNKFTIVSGGSSTAYFKGEVPEDATEFYALYPYKQATVSGGAVSLSLPPIQTAKLGSFADDLALMFAKADANNVLNFKNVCSHIKFTLAEDLTDIKSITLIGNKAEILAGPCSIAWNDGDPTVTVSIDSGSETYVTLRNEDGTALTPGDYYFTVLPVTFEAGFTVILSKTTGDQIAKKTNAAYEQIKTRNNILEMKPLASTAYAPHLNYFVKYNDGFDLTFGDVTINNETYPGGKLVSDNKKNSWNTATNPTGVFFIDPNCTTASCNKSQQFSSIVLIGADSSKRSDYAFTKVMRLQDAGTTLLLANLNCNVTNGIAVQQYTSSTTTASFNTFGKMIFSNCHFKNITTNFMTFPVNVCSIEEIYIDTCEFGINGDAVNVLNLASLTSSVSNIEVTNNIFYTGKAEKASCADFRLISAEKSEITNFNGNQNTFDRLVPKTNAIRLGTTSSFNFINELFVECYSDTKVQLVTFQTVADRSLVTGAMKNVAYYSRNSSAQVTAGISSSASNENAFVNMTINSLKNLENWPLNSNWAPENGVFGEYNSELTSGIGAQRPDMTASATANEASYQYPSVDLGTF
ncbi:MAG: hypothetical protein ACI4TM_02955 [Candidatus Cryptobacteroides sp.]